MQKLIGGILILVAMFYASFTEAIGTDRDLNTAIITAKQITTPPNPASGFQKIYCKPDEKCYTLNSAGEETELGSGGAADFKELMTDPSFEELTDEGVCVNCTATLVPSITTTPFNVNRLSLVFSAAGTYTVDKTTGEGFFGLPSNVECEVSTTNSDIDFAHRSNGANVATVDVDAVTIASGAGATTEVTRALKSNVIGTTSEGFQVIAGSAGTVFLDNCTVSTKQVLSSVGYDTNPVAYTPTNTQGFGTLGTSLFKWHREGAFLVINATFTAGTTDGTEAQIELPAGLSIGELGISGQAANVGTHVRSANSGNNGGAVLATTGDTFLNFSATTIFGTGSNIGNLPVGGSAVASTGEVVTLNAKVPIQGWQATFDSISDVNQNEAVTKVLSADVTTSGTTLSDLTFSDLVPGGWYEVNLSAEVTTGANSNTFVLIKNNGATIGRAGVQGSSGAAIIATYSTVVKFKAAASTLVFETFRNAGTGSVVGDGTQGSTFAQLRRIDNQINAILKDVVMSPGSSNGKPVSCSASISASDVVTDEVGDCINSVTSAATGVYVVTFNSGFFGSEATPSCFFQFINSGTTERRVNFDKAATSPTGTTYRIVNYLNSLLDADVEILCRGVAP